MLRTMFDYGIVMTNITLSHPRFQRFLQSDAEFDVIVMDIVTSEALVGLGHHFKAPAIVFAASKWTTDLVGSPNILYAAYVRRFIR